MPRLLIAALLFAGLAGCGTEPSTARRLVADGACQTGSVVLAVYPGTWARLCGCDEGTGAAGAAATCTFPVAWTVRFVFPAPDGRHQLVGDATSSLFPASPVFTPDAGLPPSARVHAFLPPATGSYGFIDARGGARGTLVAR